MSGAAQLSDALTTCAEEPLQAIASSVSAARFAQAAMREADDFVDLMQAVASLIVACEGMKDAADTAQSSLRVALASAMADSGCTTIKTDNHTVSLKDAPTSALVTDPALLPAEYLRQRDPEPDRAALRKAMLAGEHIPGCTLTNGGAPTVQIRNRKSA